MARSFVTSAQRTTRVHHPQPPPTRRPGIRGEGDRGGSPRRTREQPPAACDIPEYTPVRGRSVLSTRGFREDLYDLP